MKRLTLTAKKGIIEEELLNNLGVKMKEIIHSRTRSNNDDIDQFEERQKKTEEEVDRIVQKKIKEYQIAKF